VGRKTKGPTIEGAGMDRGKGIVVWESSSKKTGKKGSFPVGEKLPILVGGGNGFLRIQGEFFWGGALGKFPRRKRYRSISLSRSTRRCEQEGQKKCPDI